MSAAGIVASWRPAYPHCIVGACGIVQLLCGTANATCVKWRGRGENCCKLVKDVLVGLIAGVVMCAIEMINA